ncbi:MAG: flagellar basal body P-ring protein FlgI [Candidatus Omnitrophica bacterium]|nr:flagellar basal body P-ring protein FlgI [Candidatus Omnitrophota bacterium]
MLSVLLGAVAVDLAAAPAQAAVRLKDIAHVQGVRENQLIGYGLVVGLNGTGDSSAASFTFQSIVSMLDKMGISISKNELSVKNVAAVMVTATLPPFIREGSRIDCTISSLGNATSLQGGMLLMTPLAGADGAVYAVAQGPVSLGGFVAGTGGPGGNTVQRNHTTVARIPQGALIEREVPMRFIQDNMLQISLKNADFTTCDRIVGAISEKFEGQVSAQAVDAGSLTVAIPEQYRDNVIGLIAQLERVEITPDAAARIVMNERTGTIVAGEHVRISTVAISHGNLSIEIKSRYQISQPPPFARAGETVAAEQVETGVEEQQARLMVMPQSVNIGDVANALNAMGVTPRDMIAIFQAMREAGALQAELIIM